MAFIAFEGLDGSGKSTLIRRLGEILKKKSMPFLMTREPGGTELGEDIRHLLLRTEGEAPTPRTELLLYQAARAQHVDMKIRPALIRKEWVLCDRFTASAVAFQCGARGLPLAEVEWLNNYATGDCKPDLWVLLDLPVEQASKRLQLRMTQDQADYDRFEREQDHFHRQVREAYLMIAQAQPKDWLVLNALESPDQSLTLLVEELRRRQWLDF